MQNRRNCGRSTNSPSCYATSCNGLVSPCAWKTALTIQPLSTSRAEGLPVKASLLLTHLHAFLLTRLSTSPASSHTVLAAAYLLSQSSGPFLSLLHGWLGLASVAADQDTDPHSQPWADMGITRTPASISDNGEPRWKYEFSSKRMPGFIPKECRRALFEAGKSLRLLREASNNQHPLCTTSWQIEVGWGWGEARPSSYVDRCVRLTDIADRKIQCVCISSESRMRSRHGSVTLNSTRT